MNIFEYVKKIAKRVSKNQILEEVGITRDELNNNTLSLLEKNLDWLRRNDRELQSGAYRRDRDDLINDFARSGFLRPTNPFDMLYKSLSNSVQILDFVEGYFNENLSEDVTASSVTLAKANVFQLLDLVRFSARYTRTWLEYILSAESNHRIQLAGEVDLTQAQIKYLGENRDAFGRAISVLATPIKRVEELISNIPEINVAEANPKAVQATQGDSRVDPFRFNLIQSRADPIYLISMMISDYQVSRYKTAKEEKEMLELRILRLKKQMANNEDPRLADIIEKRQGQLDKLRGKLQKMEDDIR